MKINLHHKFLKAKMFSGRILFLIAIALLASSNSFGQHGNNQTTSSSYYTCTMHPEIHSSTPGKCPKCGMQLVFHKGKNVPKPKTDSIKIQSDTVTHQMNDAKQNELQKEIYSCPMHPEVKSSVPGVCPKCGMQLVKKKSDTVTESKKDSVVNNEVFNPIIEKKPDAPSRTVRYDLYVKDTIVNYSGKSKHAIAINGQIPAPTLIFTEGDTAEIYVHNMLDVGTSLHWHGVFLPNQFDGVPYLTQLPIAPGETHLYKFPVIQNGTHWYHSHSELQEQSGMYGALIFKKKNSPPENLAESENKNFRNGIDDLPTIPIVLSDWLDMKPEEADRSLHNATDWFAIKKGTTQSYGEALFSGNLGTKFHNELKRMNAMDVSDIAYDKFLINGKNESELDSISPLSLEEGPGERFKAGDKIRLQVVNSGASSYFWLTWGGGKITVVANDGNDVEPVEVDRLLIAVSETYDIVITIPENMSYEFLATPEDRTSSASLWFGSGMKMPAPHLEKLKYFAGMRMMNGMMKMNGDLDMNSMGDMVMSNQTMDMNQVMYPEITGEEKHKKKNETQPNKSDNMKMDMKNMGNADTTQYMQESEQHEIVTLNYSMLKATQKTNLPTPLFLGEGQGVRLLHFTLTGNMNRYVWSLDNKVVSESDKILIHHGENIRIILFNNSMMRHPMHLHGHDFRLLNGQGDYAPLKNVLDIMPMEIDTIEFAPTEASGDWFFHCHILYHMMSGMGRVFSYENSPPNPEIPNPKFAQRKLFGDDRHFHFMTKVGLETNGSDGEAMFANTRWKLEEMWHLGYHAEHGYESETMFGRYLGKMQWWYAYAGFDYHYKVDGAPQNNFFDIMHSPQNIFGADATNLFGQTSNKNDRHTLTFGIAHTLPMLIVADARIDLNRKFRFQLSRDDIPISPRLRMNWMLNTDKEYMLGFRFIATKYISISSHYDSDMGFGIGLFFTY